MRRGFTLVELSIVLVIIGLLVGGILAGQSLIESAKMQSFVRQVQQMDIAGANFKSKYKGLAADSKLYGTVGNSNGIINDSSGNNLGVFDGELSAYWPQLQQSGYDRSGKTFVSAVTGTIKDEGTNRNIPTSYSGCGFLVGMGSMSTNFYWLSNYDAADINFSTITDCMLPSDALAYDSKVDDGLPSNGIVTYFDYTGQCVSTGKYNITNTGKVCSIAISLLGQAGE